MIINELHRNIAYKILVTFYPYRGKYQNIMSQLYSKCVTTKST